MDYVPEASQVYELVGATEVEHKRPIGRILGLLEHEQELEQTALARAVGAEQRGHVAEPHVQLPPRLEIVKSERFDHLKSSERPSWFPVRRTHWVESEATSSELLREGTLSQSHYTPAPLTILIRFAYTLNWQRHSQVPRHSREEPAPYSDTGRESNPLSRSWERARVRVSPTPESPL